VARSVAVEAPKLAVAMIGWPARVEALLRRAEELLDRTEATRAKAAAVASAAADIVESASVVAQSARATTSSAQEAVARVEKLYDVFSEPLQELSPLVAEASDALTVQHVQSLAQLMDQVPQVLDLVAPAMRNLAVFAPDLDDLAGRLNAVGEIVEGLPGAGLLRRRGQAAEADDQAPEETSSADADRS
jgi:hypothetical protein